MDVRQEIMHFHAKEGETFTKSWDKFKKVNRRCPNHAIAPEIMLECFYMGMPPDVQSMLDTATGGDLGVLKMNEAFPFIEKLALKKASAIKKKSIWVKFKSSMRKPSLLGRFEMDSSTIEKREMTRVKKELEEMEEKLSRNEKLRKIAQITTKREIQSTANKNLEVCTMIGVPAQNEYNLNEWELVPDSTYAMDIDYTDSAVDTPSEQVQWVQQEAGASNAPNQ